MPQENFAQGHTGTGPLVLVTQTVENRSDVELTFNGLLNGGETLAAMSTPGDDVSSTLAGEAVYIDAQGKNDTSVGADGAAHNFFQITLAAGESVEIQLGYGISDEQKDGWFTYYVNPFGLDQSATQRVELGYVE